jgi:hypothetical protein
MDAWTQEDIDSFMDDLVSPEEEAKRDYSKFKYTGRRAFYSGLSWALCMDREYGDSGLLDAFHKMYPEATQIYMAAAEKRYAKIYAPKADASSGGSPLPA